jgi:hypothetical protein
MLTLTGTIRAAMQLGGGTNRKTGEVIALRSIVQIEGTDHRGLVQLFTLTVPDHSPYVDQIGERFSFPVRTWAVGGAEVRLSHDPR